MKMPKILLSTAVKNQNYVDAVEKLGGIAVAQYLPAYDSTCDGLILCGGSDISPDYYGEEINGSVNIDDARDKAEMELIRQFVEAGKPILGICRGCQILNVYFGGSLYQHITNAKDHASNADYDLIHPVTAVQGSLLGCLYGTEFTVNSYHHQAVKILGKGFRITMTSGPEQIVEAIEHETLPIFAVQWHPERMCFANKREDTVDGAEIFKYFLSLFG